MSWFSKSMIVKASVSCPEIILITVCAQKLLYFWKADRILVVYDVTQNRKALHSSTIPHKQRSF